MVEPSKKLVKLYADIAEHTKPVCSGEHPHGCRVPFSCCHESICELVIEEAKWKGVELQRTDHPRLPLMGPTGCTAAPHLRPMCAVHACPINNVGVIVQDRVWSKRYWTLRNQITTLELKAMAKNP